MGDVCVGGTLAPQSGQWAVFTKEDADACRNSGGQVQSSGGLCGASAAAQSGGGSVALADAAVSPLRLIRADLAGVSLVADLDRLNREAATEIAAMASDQQSAEMLGASVGAVAQFAAAMLGDSEETAQEFRYTEGLHRQLTQLAGELKYRVDEDLAATVDRIVATAETLVGSSALDIRAGLKESADTAS